MIMETLIKPQTMDTIRTTQMAVVESLSAPSQFSCTASIQQPQLSSEDYRYPLLEPADGFSCSFCSKMFTQKRNCARHEREWCSKNPEKEIKKFSCEECAASFTSKYNLNTHIKSYCRTEQNESQSQKNMRKKTPCFVEDCKFVFYHRSSLISHLVAHHNDVVNLKAPITLVFYNYEDFLSWKEKEEAATFSYFSQKGGKVCSFKHSVTYFYCQHDGSGKPHCVKKSNRKNKKGQIKVGDYCIANMRTSVENDGKIHVKYFPTHSHVCRPADVIHHPLPRNINKFIEQQITDEVPPSEILKIIQSTYTPINTENSDNFRGLVLTKKRIRERARRQRIARKFYIDAKAFSDIKDDVKAVSDIQDYVKAVSNVKDDVDRHERGLSIPDESVSEVCDNMWEVLSVKTQNLSFVVERLNLFCSEDLCYCKCSNSACFELCSHLYHCSCPDNHPLCEHVHKIHSLSKRNECNVMTNNSEFYILPTSNEDSEDLQAFNSTTETKFEEKYNHMVERLQCNLSLLNEFLMTAKKNQVPEDVLTHVDSLIEVIAARVKNLDKEHSKETLHGMKPVGKLNTQEKLKTQLSKLLSFERPVLKRENESIASELARKKLKS